MKSKKPEIKKETRFWSIASLVLGIFSVFLYRSGSARFIFGITAVGLSFIQKKKSTISFAGLILGSITIFSTALRYFGYYEDIFIFVAVLLFLLWLLMKKVIKKDRAWSIASLVLGILSILFIRSPSAALPLGIGAILFYVIQKKQGQTIWGIAGLITGSLGTLFALTYVFEYFWIKWMVIILLVLYGQYMLIKKWRNSKKPSRNYKILKIVLIIIGSLIVLFVVIGFIVSLVEQLPTTCETKECFIGEANDCTSVVLEITEEAGTIRYVSEPSNYFQCSIEKTLVALHESESQAMKDLLEGKSVTCDYWRGDFDEQLVYSLVDGLEVCSGDLKEAIGNLIIFAE